MDHKTENLQQQSQRIKEKVNVQVEYVFDQFMKLDPKISKESRKDKIDVLKGLSLRIDMLKKIKESICE